jgi:hypothetical protein
MNQFTTILLSLVFITGQATAQQASGNTAPEKETPAIFSLPRFHAQVIRAEQDALLFQVQVNNPEQKLVRVTIDGNELMPYEYDCSSARTYQKSFNFCNMDDGLYRVKITCGKETVIRKVRLSTQIDVKRTTTIE